MTPIRASVRRVYVAAPKGAVARARNVAAQVRALGLVVVSTWHDGDVPSTDPSGFADALAILRANVADLERATTMIALPDREVGRETYVEIGRALGEGYPIIMSAERGGLPLSWADPLVRVVGTDDDTVAELARRMVYQ